MDNKLRNLLGLLQGGKRHYKLKEGEVSQADFEYCVTLNQVLFGERGLAETLGPTWSMVHDPRFDALERIWVVEHPSMFGGDSVQGIQRQNADGTFDGSFAAIEQYAEMLAEGRNMIGFLRCRAILDAVTTLYPERQLRIDPRDSFGPLKLVDPVTPFLREQLTLSVSPSAISDKEIETLSDEALDGLVSPAIYEQVGVLSFAEKQKVIALADSYEIYNPHNLKHWPEEELWKILFSEYENYFTRAGKPNKLAIALFRLFRADLTGLVADFAEVANVQETVLLDDTSELYDPERHGEEADRVSMEVENLERALTYRAELRSTAYQVLNQLGIGHLLGADGIDLTDAERDNLLKTIYTSDFLHDKPATLTSIMGFLMSIKVIGLSRADRESRQLAAMAETAQAHVQGLKDGSIQPVSRYTEEVIDDSHLWTPEERMVHQMLSNPIAAHTFHRLTGIERRLEALEQSFLLLKEGPVHGAVHNGQTRSDLLRQWIGAALKPDQPLVSNHAVSDEEIGLLTQIEALTRAREILRPVFEDADFQWTDDAAADLLTRVEYLDPTPGLNVVEAPEGADPGRPETWTAE